MNEKSEVYVNQISINDKIKLVIASIKYKC
jgi:hypothetical protein